MSPLLVEQVAGVPDMVHAAVAVPVQDPTPPPGKGEEFGKASPIALVVIILLALATVVLIRGMSKRIRRLPGTFDQPAEKQSGRDPEDSGKEGS